MRLPPRGLAPGLAFTLLLAPLAVAPIANNDIWLHLKTGGILLAEGRVPRVDLYTFTRAGTPLIPHESLAQLLFALLHRLGGTTALSLFYAAIVGAVLWLVHRTAARAIRRDAGPAAGLAGPAATLTTLATFVMLQSFLSVRPHLFSFLCAAAAVAILPELEASARRVRIGAALGLLGLQILWANLHGAFVLGIALAAIQVLALSLRRGRVAWPALLPVGLAAVSCLNPAGWRLYELVGSFSDPVFRRVIVEWRGPFEKSFIATPAFWVALVWLCLALAASLRAARQDRDPAPLLTVMVLAALAGTSRRHISLLAIVTAPIAGRGLAMAAAWLAERVNTGQAARRAAGWVPLAAVVALAGVLVHARLSGPAVAPRPGLVATNIPMEALEVMRAEGVRGRVFTTIGLGSYVTWRGWPDLLTSIDSRLEVFGGSFLEEHLAAAREVPRFRDFTAAHPFDLALLPWRLPSVRGALAAMKTDPEWALVYFDDIVMLYARRTPEHAALVGRRELRVLDPLRYLSRGDAGPGIDPAAAALEARRAAGDPPVMPGRPPINTVARRIAAAFGSDH